MPVILEHTAKVLYIYLLRQVSADHFMFSCQSQTRGKITIEIGLVSIALVVSSG